MKSAPRILAVTLALAAWAPLLLAAEDAPPSAAAGAEASAPAATSAAAPQDESPAAEAAPLVAGPVDLSLGTDVRLSLPEGWHWVPKERLQSYFGNDGRRAGAWDLGLALSPGQPLFEFRVQFEPIGAVPEAGLTVDPAAMLAKIQSAAAVMNRQRREQGGFELQIPGWSMEPAYDTAAQRLVWGERRVSGADERRGWHARLLGRAGVLKLDVESADDLMSLQTPLLQALFSHLGLAEGRGLAERQASDRAADLDLAALVLEGTLGRGSLAPGGPPAQPLAPGLLAGLAAAGTLLLAWAVVALLRFLRRRHHMQEVVAAEMERLGKLEQQLGAHADDVQEVTEDGNDAAALERDDTHGDGHA